MREVVPGASVVASGGIGSLDDIRGLAARAYEGVIVGRALYEAAFTLPEGLAAAATGEDISATYHSP
jgi:phosphoribosylformimino-5-aminoimidazole carboxamide ribonucleotide (ProFAR) isomerase